MYSQTMFSFFLGWKTKVCDFKIISRVQKNIFWFQISVHNPWNIMQILYWTQQLFEIISWKLFVKTATSILDFNIWKKIALLNKFQNDEIYLYSISIGLNHYFSIDIILYEFDDIGMIHLLQKRNFIQQYLFEYL